MWVGAELSDEGGTQVAEVIDYDFGLVRQARDLPRRSPASASSPPSRSQSGDRARRHRRRSRPIFIDGEQGMELKIGDPNTTITGRHRYLLDYALPRDVLLDAADTLRWDAVGTAVDGPHPARRGPHRGALGVRRRGRAASGAEGATGGCELRRGRAGPPRHRAWRTSTPARVSPSAPSGATSLAATPNVPAPPVTAPPTPGVGLLLPGARRRDHGARRAPSARRRSSAAPGASASAPAASPTRPWPVEAVPPARCGSTRASWRRWPPPSSRRRPSSRRPKAGCSTPSRCGPQHKVAWLIQAAIDGEIDLVEEDGRARPAGAARARCPGRWPPRSAGATRWSSAATTPRSPRGWGQIDSQLQTWSLTSGLWDPLADRRKTSVRVLGALVDGARRDPRLLRRVRGEPVGSHRDGSSSSSSARSSAAAGSRRCCGAGSSASARRSARACGCESSRSAASSTSRRPSTPRRPPSEASCASTRPGPSPSTRSIGGSGRSPAPRRSRRTPGSATSTWPRCSPAPRRRRPPPRRRAAAVAAAVRSAAVAAGAAAGSW